MCHAFCQLVQCGVMEARQEPRGILAGRGHGCFCNLLIIRDHNNEGVETWPKNGCVSTPCFITH